MLRVSRSNQSRPAVHLLEVQQHISSCKFCDVKLMHLMMLRALYRIVLHTCPSAGETIHKVISRVMVMYGNDPSLLLRLRRPGVLGAIMDPDELQKVSPASARFTSTASICRLCANV